jgi:hypothetical protein
MASSPSHRRHHAFLAPHAAETSRYAPCSASGGNWSSSSAPSSFAHCSRLSGNVVVGRFGVALGQLHEVRHRQRLRAGAPRTATRSRCSTRSTTSRRPSPRALPPTGLRQASRAAQRGRRWRCRGHRTSLGLPELIGRRGPTVASSVPLFDLGVQRRAPPRKPLAGAGPTPRRASPGLPRGLGVSRPAFGCAGLWRPRSPRSSEASLWLTHKSTRVFAPLLPYALGSAVGRTLFLSQQFGRPWRLTADEATRGRPRHGSDAGLRRAPQGHQPCRAPLPEAGRSMSR